MQNLALKMQMTQGPSVFSRDFYSSKHCFKIYTIKYPNFFHFEVHNTQYIMILAKMLHKITFGILYA